MAEAREVAHLDLEEVARRRDFRAEKIVTIDGETAARLIDADPACVTDPILSLDLAKAGITTILWATGFALDFGWLKLDAFDANGRPRHQRGVSVEPGLYFLGLPWQTRRGSSFIWGVWYDAKYVADHLAKQRGYLAYSPSPAHATVDA